MATLFLDSQSFGLYLPPTSNRVFGALFFLLKSSSFSFQAKVATTSDMFVQPTNSENQFKKNLVL